MQTLIELKEYLAAHPVYEQYTGWNTIRDVSSSEQFQLYTTPAGIDDQTSFPSSSYQAKWWIVYNEEDDEFILRVGYFTNAGEAISREEFINEMSDELYASKYTEEYTLRWVNQNNEYILVVPVNTLFPFPITKIIPKS